MLRFAFQFSAYRVRTLFHSLVCIFRLLMISEYLPKTKIFMVFIRSNVFVEKLTKVLKDKHFPLTFECLILIRWISFTQTKTIILRSENCNQDTWLKFSSHKTTTIFRILLSQRVILLNAEKKKEISRTRRYGL